MDIYRVNKRKSTDTLQKLVGTHENYLIATNSVHSVCMEFGWDPVMQSVISLHGRNISGTKTTKATQCVASRLLYYILVFGVF